MKARIHLDQLGQTWERQLPDTFSPMVMSGGAGPAHPQDVELFQQVGIATSMVLNLARSYRKGFTFTVTVDAGEGGQS